MGRREVTYLLDTHVAIWWLTEDRKLPKAHGRLLEKAERSGTPIGISAISFWEIAKLVESGRLAVDESVSDLLERLDTHPRIEVLPLSRDIAIESCLLGGRFPRDPGDQIIAATARCHGLTLLTADQRIIDSGAVNIA